MNGTAQCKWVVVVTELSNTAVHEFEAKTAVPRYNWVFDLTELVSKTLMLTLPCTSK